MADTPFPPQHQSHQPGREGEMKPRPASAMENWKPTGKLTGKVAIVTGGDSGIGRAVAIGFAKEGADVAILYFDETEDAKDTKRRIEAEGRRCLAIAGDIGDPQFCQDAVKRVVQQFGQLDILVNNAAEQHICGDFAEIKVEQVERTFRTNILGQMWLTKAALPHLKAGSSIINSTSVTAYKGSPALIDYASTKGAIVAFTRSLSMSLEKKGIRVNAVAPGPTITNIEATFASPLGAERVQLAMTLLPEAAEADALAASITFLLSDDGVNVNGVILPSDGGWSVA
jgi:NAD(P)-dependent dehydrogenase (short-subunit alcohol dehydrogenase family)